MQPIIRKFVERLQQIWLWVKLKSQPVTDKITSLYQRAALYYRTHPKAKRWSIIASIVLGPPLLLLLIVWIEIPSKKELRNIQNHEATEVYSADSVLLGRFYIQDRTAINFDEISPIVVQALIATEDIRFYEHDGVDYISLGRVIVKSIFMGEESSGGGSTISQQLAKNLYPRKKYWVLSMLINKMKEAITAQRLEDIYDKNQLITLYLNTVPFGDEAFGIQAAAKRFFSTTAKKLTAGEAAVLIGMLKATHTYNPRLFPDRSKTRRNVVLSQMEKAHYIDSVASDSIRATPLTLKYTKLSFHQGLAPYFREFLKTELMQWCKNHKKPDGTTYNVYTDGLKIYTTIDSRLQEYAEIAVERHMKELQKQFIDQLGKDKPWKDNEAILRDAILRTSQYKALAEDGMSEEEIMEELKKPIDMRLFSWNGIRKVKMSPIDSIIHHIQFLNAGFLAIEPQTGAVKAWVGGIDHDFFQYDHVKTSTKRQVGSIFKPIVYAMAIENGASPCEYVSAERQTYIDDEGEKWTPKNMQNDYQVKYSMRGALAYSVNTIAVKMIQRAGVSNTVELARNMGILSEMPNVPSVALGSSSISLMEMTTAYGCIANEGLTTPTHYITSVKDQYGNSFTDLISDKKPKQVISKETAMLVRRMLQTVVHEGTASRLRWKYGVYNDVAGKTGTTQSNADGWFMAITPNLAVGTWAGADDPRIHFKSTELGQGSNTALPMFGYFMEQVNKDKAFATLSKATFPAMPSTLQQKLDCDLYELDESLQLDIAQMIQQADSLMKADTLAPPHKETFLEKLYKRKLKMLQASMPQDSTDAEEMEGVEL
ncbi:transglycosylase domain-containing protein [Pseudochryseolinea flava]|uniref:Penicillin-binding protein n=1 Tax=Pseudochryseolinea flava TaxID=2059302 RepID=A0A364XWH5_9BACT|nr:transglycosylase domain-containing protein [Pseudochryseolinea flava]RAV98747.1 penicillin-binding protein [Pseudochryseolinea flava]